MRARPPGPSLFDASCVLPTEFGDFDMHVLREGSQGKEAVVLSRGVHAGRRGVLLRVHDMCMTSEVFHSSKCDCRQQLREAQRRLSQHPDGGVIIYLQQEGRGIGITDKIRAYQLQDEKGADTVDANRMLGLPDDTRTYDCVPRVLRALAIRSVTLMTNNPRKVEHLRGLGVAVDGCVVAGVGTEKLHERAATYVATKRRRMRHFAGAGGSGAGGSGAGVDGSTDASAGVRVGAGADQASGADNVVVGRARWADGRVLRVCDTVQDRVRQRWGWGSGSGEGTRRRRTQRVRASGGGNVVAATQGGPAATAAAAAAAVVATSGGGARGSDGTNCPVVTLAYAQSLDGAIAARPRQMQQPPLPHTSTAKANAHAKAEKEPRLLLSGPESNGLTHALRATHDAVLVGIGTALSDDPLLTVRYDASGAPLAADDVPPPHEQPAGVVLDSGLRTPLTSRLVRSAAAGRRVIVVTTKTGLGATTEASAVTEKQLRARRLREAGAEVVVLQGQGQGQDLHASQVVWTLGASCGLRSIMVEGGAAIIASFLAASVRGRGVQASANNVGFSARAAAVPTAGTAAIATANAASSTVLSRAVSGGAGGSGSGSGPTRPLVDFLVVTISPHAMVGSSGVRPAYRRHAPDDPEHGDDDADAAQSQLPQPLQLASANSFVLGDGDIIVFSDNSGQKDTTTAGTKPLQQRSNL